ncbi:hypothetical protein GBAR_LOCUS4656 [Geodia barretti]|uniref:Uncharacterized protein n=1 Tax=Geodia barretti TaxID=519541 RepID=A0AA35R8S9_GEOBA|nr:hypothetical protein GBAR_LOCUS4656 [Geodia barretti]
MQAIWALPLNPSIIRASTSTDHLAESPLLLPQVCRTLALCFSSSFLSTASMASHSSILRPRI